MLSYEDFIGNQVEAAQIDPELEIKPMNRKLKELVQHTHSIVLQKAQNMDKALTQYAAEANTEFIEKD